MINVIDISIRTAHESIKSGEYTAHELYLACKKNFEDKNKEIFALLEFFDDAEVQAKHADEMFKNGTHTIMTGIPIVLKDNILYKGHIASSASKILENYVAAYSSPIVEKLLAMGAVIVGRANMDEFAMGSSTENSAYGTTRNPLDNTRVAGGSSGGSVAAVASGMCIAALGSDTGGSIRQPAAFCGLVGYKPSYGYVTRHGVYAMANSFDQIGPIAKSVDDIKIMYRVISFYDSHDSTSVKEDIRNEKKFTGSIKKIGVPWNMIEIEGIDPGTLSNFKQNIIKLEEAGYEIVPIDLPLAPYSLAVYYIIMPAEVSTNLSRFDGIRYGDRKEAKDLVDVYKKTRGEGFGKETKRRIMLGSYILSHGYYDAYYKKAIAMKAAITKEFEKIFETVDVVVTPTTPSPAFKIGEKISDPLQMYLSDIFSVPANIATIPAVSIPSRKNADGMPYDFQVLAKKHADDELLDFSSKVEKLII